MIYNDILRRLRYSFDFNDTKMIAIFKLAGLETTSEQISNWLRKDDDKGFQLINDAETTSFLNGLIIEKRGLKDGASPVASGTLTNNVVLLKLKIALNMKDSDIIEVMKLSDFKVGKHELSALFRKKDHVNYRVCEDQFLRNFLKGLQIKIRP